MRDLLIVFLSIDVVFVASVWNYGKFMAVVAALTLIWVRERRASLLIMTGLFLFMLVDDYYELHDQIARALGENISIGALDGLHPQNRGELFVYATILAFVVPLLWFALKNVQPDARAFVGALAVGLLMIGLFGVAIDVLHGVLDAMLGELSEAIRKIINRLMTILEDGGEMVAVSVCAWLCLARLWERAAD